MRTFETKSPITFDNVQCPAGKSHHADRMPPQCQQSRCFRPSVLRPDTQSGVRSIQTLCFSTGLRMRVADGSAFCTRSSCRRTGLKPVHANVRESMRPSVYTGLDSSRLFRVCITNVSDDMIHRIRPAWTPTRGLASSFPHAAMLASSTLDSSAGLPVEYFVPSTSCHYKAFEICETLVLQCRTSSTAPC